jgi:hypothetical protein
MLRPAIKTQQTQRKNAIMGTYICQFCFNRLVNWHGYEDPTIFLFLKRLFLLKATAIFDHTY